MNKVAQVLCWCAVISKDPSYYLKLVYCYNFYASTWLLLNSLGTGTFPGVNTYRRWLVLRVRMHRASWCDVLLISQFLPLIGLNFSQQRL
jgi:hypothetical protein